MKKLFSLLLILAMVFCMAACGAEQADEPEAAEDIIVKEEVPQVIEELVGKEMITLHVDDQTYYDGDRFGGPDYENLLTVRYDGEIITAYLVTMTEEKVGNIFINDDGSLFFSARTEGECFFTVGYGDASATFEWYTY